MKASELLSVAEDLEAVDHKLAGIEKKAQYLHGNVTTPLRGARSHVRGALEELDKRIGEQSRKEHRERPQQMVKST